MVDRLQRGIIHSQTMGLGSGQSRLVVLGGAGEGDDSVIQRRKIEVRRLDLPLGRVPRLLWIGDGLKNPLIQLQIPFLDRLLGLAELRFQLLDITCNGFGHRRVLVGQQLRVGHA